MATKSFHDNVIIKNEKTMERLEAIKEKGCAFGYVAPLTTEERERQKKAAQEWMSRR